MSKYQNSKIYKLVSYQTESVYYGFCDTLSKRLCEHNHNYMRWMNGRYITSYEICVYDDVQIILVEEYPCKNKKDMITREKEHIKNDLSCVNKTMRGKWIFL